MDNTCWICIYLAMAFCIALGMFLASLFSANHQRPHIAQEAWSETGMENFLRQRWMLAEYWNTQENWEQAAKLIYGAALSRSAVNDNDTAACLMEMSTLAILRADMCRADDQAD